MSAFRVLMVCTANHCRSPMAQQLLAHEAAAQFGLDQAWQVESAGTDVRAPWPMHEHASTVLAERLAEVGPHHSRDLTPTAIAEADLVLTASRAHRSSVVSMVPAALGRSFTILQFARLCALVAPITAGNSGDLGRELIVQAKLARSSMQPVPVELDDLADPMGGPLTDFRTCADELQVAIDAILRPLQLELPAQPVAVTNLPGSATGSPRRLGRHRAPR